MDRRDFLKSFGAGVSGLAAMVVLPKVEEISKVLIPKSILLEKDFDYYRPKWSLPRETINYMSLPKEYDPWKGHIYPKAAEPFFVAKDGDYFLAFYQGYQVGHITRAQIIKNVKNYDRWIEAIRAGIVSKSVETGTFKHPQFRAHRMGQDAAIDLRPVFWGKPRRVGFEDEYGEIEERDWFDVYNRSVLNGNYSFNGDMEKIKKEGGLFLCSDSDLLKYA